MCGRFQLAVELDKILERYGILEANVDFSPKQEVFPSNKSAIIVNNGGENKLEMFNWGFTASFTKRLLINARSETVSVKKIFKDSFMYRRCLIPVSGYYEWKKENDKSIKYIIYTKEDIFSLAGIYKSFKDSGGKEINQYTILTRPANEDLKDIHDRMPVIIDRNFEDIWIDGKIKDNTLLDNIMRASDKELLRRIV